MAERRNPTPEEEAELQRLREKLERENKVKPVEKYDGSHRKGK